MRKFTHFLSMTLMALMLVPTSANAELIYPELKFVGADGSVVRQVEATLGETFNAPTLTCDYPEAVLRNVRYSSSNERVAAVDTLSGYVTLYSAGNTMIIASYVGDTMFAAARAMYTLIVNEQETPPVAPECPNAYFYANGEPIKVLTIKVGESVSIPNLLGETGAVYRLSRKSIENSQIAMLTEDDMIYGVAEGSTMLIGYMITTVDGETLTCEYDLAINVEAATPVVEPTCPEAKYYYNGAELTTMTLKVGDVVDIPTLMGVTGAIYRLSAKTVEGIRVAELTEDDQIHAVGQGTALFIGMFVYIVDGQTKNCEYSFDIVVEAGETPQCPDAKFYYNGAVVESITLKVGDAIDVPVLMEATGAMLSGRTSIEDTNVATLTADNLIHALAEGRTRYHVIYSRTLNDGSILSCEYDCGIIVEAAAPQKDKPELSFDPQEVNIELGDKVVVPTIINPHNIAFTPANSKWYTAWDSQVARVDEVTGEVTILGVGDEIISFEFTGNDEYEAQIIGYNLHVTTMALAIGGVIVNNSNKDDVFGDGSISYDPITHTLTMISATVQGAGINLAPALVRAAKADEQIEAAILYADNAPLTIVLIGGNAVLGADAGILSQYAPIVMKSSEGAYGTARISGTTVGIKAEALKLYKCNVTAYGSAAGVAVNELGVATGANLVAQGSGMAIQANSLVLAEDHDGEGIAILTEGVTFKPKQGFFDKEGKIATFVEIGKVVIVPTEEEVTTIDFTQTDPEGNESVIFSADVNNTFNEETGQLEITTSISDEIVEQALEELIPGSSAWVDLLPGSLTFDIPAGEGEIKIYCMTLPGYTLKVKMEGEAAVVITQEELGWAKVTYNIPAPIHVVIYLHGSAPASSPARIAANMEDTDPGVGAYIQAVKIAPKDAPDPNPTTVIDIIEANNGENGKIIMNGQLFIIREGHVFNAQGVSIK